MGSVGRTGSPGVTGTTPSSGPCRAPGATARPGSASRRPPSSRASLLSSPNPTSTTRPTTASWRPRRGGAPRSSRRLQRQEVSVRRPSRPCEDGEALSGVQGASAIRPRRLDWARLLWRSFTTDVLTCVTCGGRRHVLALVQDPSSIHAILTHLGLTPTTAPTVARPRPPPQGALDLSTTT